MGVVQFIQTENSSLVTQRKLLKVHSKSVEALLSKKSMKFTKNETPHKQQISDEAREILKKNMTLEYDFYEFIKQRLKAQTKYLKRKTYPKYLFYLKRSQLAGRKGNKVKKFAGNTPTALLLIK